MNTKNTRESKTTYRFIDDVKMIIAIVTIFVLIPGIVGSVETHYTMDSVVIQTTANEITVEDTTGNVWSFKGDNYKVGEKVQVVFFTNYTDNTRKDDIVVNVKNK